MVCKALLSDIYRNWYLPPGSSTKYGCCSPIVSYQSLKTSWASTCWVTCSADDSYEIEAILKINKRGTHAKVKWVGYNSSHNQCFQLSEIQDTAPEGVHSFFRGEERARVCLRPRKITWEIVLVLSHMRFYVYRLIKVKVTNYWVTELKKFVKHCTQACSCIVLMFYAALGGPSWFLPLVRQKASKEFLILLVV